jgi:hypothetical protein
MAALAALYEGVGAQLAANNSLTISLGDFAISFVMIYQAKRTAGLDAIQKDVQNYLKASLNFSDPTAPAQAAAFNEDKNIDTSVMDTGCTAIDDMIENAKSDAQTNETDMQSAIASQEPINQYLRSVLNLIATGLM